MDNDDDVTYSRRSSGLSRCTASDRARSLRTWDWSDRRQRRQTAPSSIAPFGSWSFADRANPTSPPRARTGSGRWRHVGRCRRQDWEADSRRWRRIAEVEAGSRRLWECVMTSAHCVMTSARWSCCPSPQLFVLALHAHTVYIVSK